MRDIWYSDNRDLIKWGVLAHIARMQSLKTIVQVPYWRKEEQQPHFSFREKRVALDQDVWSFFRNIRHIKRLSEQLGVNIAVFDDEFTHSERKAYSQSLSRHLADCKRPLLVFLDPDTGLEPEKLNVTHTTLVEVTCAWKDLMVGDWLVFYQHARRETGWVESVSAQLSRACAGAKIEVARSEAIGNDVAFLCAEKRAG